jgi:hypothetical protein
MLLVLDEVHRAGLRGLAVEEEVEAVVATGEVGSSRNLELAAISAMS